LLYGAQGAAAAVVLMTRGRSPKRERKARRDRISKSMTDILRHVADKL